jgi:signal transduction histidine kinase/CheY-like chemotaxis protein
MRLSTRFATAIIAHVILSVAVFSALNYRVFEVAGMPWAAERFAALTRGLADNLKASTDNVRADLAGLRAMPAVDGFVRARLNSDVDPTDGATQALLKARVEARCSAVLAADPRYQRCQLIELGEGRAVVDVAPDPAAAGVDPQHDDDLIRQAASLADREIAVAIAPGPDAKKPFVSLDAASVVRAPTGAAFGLVVLTTDLSPVLASIRTAINPPRPLPLAALPWRATFVVDAHGRYLADPAPELGLVFGARLQDDFPGLTEASLAVDQFGPLIMNDRSGARFGIETAGVRLAGGPRVTVIQAVPYASLFAAQHAVLISSAIGAVIASAAAIALAVFLARSMSRPLVQMTRAVTAFGHGEPMLVPIGASGEIGVLAAAFARMAAEVSEKTAAMRRNAEIFDVIMARMADAVLLIDNAGAIVFANTAAKDLLGTRANLDWDAWTRTYQTFRADGVTPLRAEEWPIVRAARGENIDNVEIAFRPCGDERAVHVVVSGRPLDAAGNAPHGAVLVFRDVTAWKETERLLRDSQKMEAIGQLTGGIAHDFNNMLTVITGTIDILIQGVADRPTLAAIARMIDEAATRGADLTRQLLAFARKQPLQPRDTDINELVVNTAKLLRPALGEGIEIVSRLEDGVWQALIDPTQLSTALLNLALNARDAMANGGVLTLATANVVLDEAYARVSPEVAPGRYVMIAVNDTGTGIPAALRDKVFEPFFTTKEVGKGTGLGLSMVYGFVKQSGGHIKIDSEDGKGTTFRLFLPRSSGDAVPEAMPVVTWQGGHETILVVEDDALVRSTVIARLESLGYATIAAVNAAEAMAMVERGAAFDLLFTDVVMPGGINGPELAAEIARRRPGVKVLYTSGYAESAGMNAGRLDPGVVLLNKPYRKVDLALRIREVLATQPAEEYAG